MRRVLACALACVAVAFATATAAHAQFGQNKVAYERFEWKTYPSPHFDVHYYGEREAFLEDIVSFAESAYLKISKDLDHELRFRVPLIVYRTHGDFEQTNVTLGEIPEAVGAFAEPVQNRMVLPADQPPDKLYQLIAHELTHIFQYSIFFEGYFGRALRSNVPLWLMEGMASYLAQDEDNLDRMVIRDAVVNNVVPPVQALDVLSFLTYRFGHAIFDFIEQEHGKEGLRNFVYEYRKVLLTNNVEKALKEAFGYEPEEFNRRFNRYLRKKYFPVLLEKKAPEDYGREIGIRREGVFSFSPTISPSGELVAALASPDFELDLVVLSAEDGSVVRNLTKGWSNSYQNLVAEAFEGKRDLSWSPTADEVAVFVRRENLRPLRIYDALTGKLRREFELAGYAQCASPAFAPDGKRVAFEANRDGTVDLFEIDLESGAVRNLTQDDFPDANPWYASDGRSIIYNRRIGASWKIFSVDVADPARKTQITFGDSLDIQPSYSRDGKTVYFSSDRSGYGVFNINALDLATGEIRQYTDVVGGCFAPSEMAPRSGEPVLVFTAFFEGTFRLFRMPLRQPEARLAPDETAGPGDTQPFEPPLRLTIDPARTANYRARWDLDAPSVAVGLTDDGTFLSNVSLGFSDLLGDQRVQLLFSSVSDYSNLLASYANLSHRLQWGASIYDFRDYYVVGYDRRQVSRATGGQFQVQYPISRLLRVEGLLGAVDQSQDYYLGTDPRTGPQFQRLNDRFLLTGGSLIGDTTRYQRFGPFQGKRFNVGFLYGLNLGGDTDGDYLEYRVDYRAYRQMTRRSLIAWRVTALINAGDRETFTGFGGINQLRGYDFREFYGSNLAWSNFEIRFPLVDELRFPFGPIRDIRGFFFADAGAAWLADDAWYDPDTFAIRSNVDIFGRATIVPFDGWDSENSRLQDVRASYGVGFQFFFLGGLQFNWTWSHRLPYTRFVDTDANPFVVDLQKIEGDSDGWRSDFYIVFDW